MKIGIVMGSDSDLPIMKDAATFLTEIGIDYEISIISAHRAPQKLFDYASGAIDNGFSVIIAGAGCAAHLPGVIAALTTIPVIGVPIKSEALNGIDSLYSIVQMPSGIPVATVAINGARNAGILAAEILSVSDKSLRSKLRLFKDKLNQTVEEKDDRLKKLGWEAYITQN